MVLMNRKQRRAAERLKKARTAPAAKTVEPKVPTVSDLLADGFSHHQAGRLDEAERRYRQILLADDRHANSFYLLGLIAYQRRHLDAALELINKAISLNGKVAAFHYNLGAILHDKGKMTEAVASYERAIALKAGYAEAYNNLGNALHDQGKLADAIASYERAIALRADYAEAHYNLGNAFKAHGKLTEAVASYERALALKPAFAEAHNNLGSALKRQGKLADAVASHERAIALKPAFAEAHYNLGNALQDQGTLIAAVASYERALALKPAFAEAHYNLGNAFKTQDKLAEAVTSYERAIANNVAFAEAHNNLGNALQDQGKLADAVACYERAIALKPDYADAHNNLANALQDQGKLADAVTSYERAIALEPALAEAYNNLGNALHDQGKLADAMARYERAIALKPSYAEARYNLGNAFKIQGRLADAVASYERAIALKPDYAEAHSNLLLSLHYSSAYSNADIFAKTLRFSRQFELPQDTRGRFVNSRIPERRLRVGYVSADFGNHSVGYFLTDVLPAHDRNAVEVFCYSNRPYHDETTEQLRRSADHWRSIHSVPDSETALMVQRDAIDILVDLSGHTAGNRLLLFARRAAPVQVTWLGYPDTTGLAAMNYRLVDAVTDPQDEADARATETLIRLEGGFLCYGGAKNARPPASSPCLRTNTVTFGSFNNPAKLSALTLDAWAQLLVHVPKARLLLKGKPFADATTRELLLSRLAKRRVTADRVELVAWLPSPTAHLQLYDSVDIALDPFPYNGTTTTCEALWMGVPIVALCGNRHAGRVGASLLTQVGLTDCIAASVEDYIAIAAKLASDPHRLDELRRTLRPRLAASSLCDGPAFARKIEAAYRTMWQKWCRAGGY